MNRDFKGIWIPKEIWLSKDLTLQEKVFLVEISSLDNENGCFASNSYFAEFFGLSKSRTATIINNLVKKKYLKSKLIYKTGSKQVDKRILRVLDINKRISETGNGTSYVKGGISETSFGTSHSMGGYFGNEKDNNTFNNTVNNTINNTQTRDEWDSSKIKNNKFKIFWTIYDKSVNKENTLIEWNKLDENTKDEILLYIPNYVKSKSNKRFQKDPLNFINDKTWNDEIIFKDGEVKKSTNKSNKDKYEEIY